MISVPLEVRPEVGDSFANAWIGRPFVWDGRTERGVDCWGLVWRLHFDCLGIELPDWHKGAQNRGWIARTLAAERESPRWQSLDGPEPGCMVLALPAGRPAHVGIFWRGRVLHADLNRGVIFERACEFAILHPGHEWGRYLP